MRKESVLYVVQAIECLHNINDKSMPYTWRFLFQYTWSNSILGSFHVLLISPFQYASCFISFFLSPVEP